MAQSGENAVEDARRLSEARLKEVGDERQRLQRAVAHLGDSRGSSSRGQGKRRNAPRKRAKASAGRAGRGERGRQLLDAVKAKPGSTGAELAKRIGVSASQVYPLLAKAQVDGAIVKDGKRYRPK